MTDEQAAEVYHLVNSAILSLNLRRYERLTAEAEAFVAMGFEPSELVVIQDDRTGKVFVYLKSLIEGGSDGDSR